MHRPLKNVTITYMNLYFRLALLLFKHILFRLQLDIMQTSKLPFNVWPTDLDLNLHMNNGRYLALMDLGRFELMLRTGLFKKGLTRRWMPVVADIKIRYWRSLKPFQRAELSTRLVGWDSRWFYLEQRFEQDGHLMARALVKAAFVKAGQTLPTADVLAVMNTEIAMPPLPDEFQKGWVTRLSTRSLIS